MTKSITIALAATVSLMAGTATLAQSLENVARIEQDGVDNATTINQAGLGNASGTEDLPMLQDGFSNELTIDQSGIGNQIGTRLTGLQQNNILQGPTGINTIDITQDGTENIVFEVFQQIDGVVPANGNRLSVAQSEGDDNRINIVTQSIVAGMPGQSADIVMLGSGNLIDVISQISTSNLLGAENTISVRLDGNNNGTQSLRGVSQLNTITSGRLIQKTGSEDTNANGNIMQLSVQGNDTAFGIVQGGRGNRTGAIIITGDDNSLGIDQDGLDNDLTIGLIAGADNEIGISQYGTNNAFLNLMGNSDGNSVLIDQMGTNDADIVIEGNTNTLNIVQDYLNGTGGKNFAEVTVIGSDNAGAIRQEGQNNSLSFVVDGDLNNRLGSVFTAANAPQGLIPGSFVQSGTDNSFVGELDGDSNLAAFLQQGNLNSIILNVSGTENEAILRQLGSGNTADLSQNGRANVAVFLQ